MLVRYVLGLLPTRMPERLDEASIVDDEVAARLRHVETDLIDSYVQGQLSGATLGAVRVLLPFVASPPGEGEVGGSASERRRSIGGARRACDAERPHRAVRPGSRGSVAAATLVIVASGVAFSGRRPGRLTLATENGACDLRPERAAVRRPRGDRRETGSARFVSARGCRVRSGFRSPRKRAASPERVVAVVLLPPTRAVAPIPTLAIPAGVDRVRVRAAARIERLSELSSWAEASGDRSHSVAQRLDCSSALPRTRHLISVVVPANLLGPQHYSLDLTGRGAGGRAEVIGSYTVQIVQP